MYLYIPKSITLLDKNNMETINDQLKNLYSKYFDNFIKELLKLEKESNEECSNPLLMYCWENEYEKANVKLLFIGEETNTWYEEDSKGNNSLDDNIKFYERFSLDSNNKINSPFWKFIKQINEHFNGESAQHAFLWTNINKIGRKTGVGAPSKDFLKIEKEKFNVLEEEIKITKPDVIIFMTGKEGEYHLSGKLPVSREPENLDNDLYIQKIECTGFENTLFLRTYHPQYMWKSGKSSDYINKIIEIIEEHKK